MKDHFARRHNREAILWALLCFSTWHRMFAETTAVRPYAASLKPLAVSA